MFEIRRAQDRGHAQHGWLDSRHTFSFADYNDPAHMGFRNLRVINEDRVQPGQGFGTHAHRDMEIISYVLEGALEHRDSMGNGSTIRPGDVQRMTAGTGVRHSEHNASATEPVHFLQIWILPARAGLTPGYEQKSFGAESKRGRFQLVASPDGRDGSVTLHADASMSAGLFGPEERAQVAIAKGRGAWVQVASGAVRVGGEVLEAGDGAAAIDVPSLEIAGLSGGEILLFDLAG